MTPYRHNARPLDLHRARRRLKRLLDRHFRAGVRVALCGFLVAWVMSWGARILIAVLAPAVQTVAVSVVQDFEALGRLRMSPAQPRACDSTTHGMIESAGDGGFRYCMRRGDSYEWQHVENDVEAPPCMERPRNAKMIFGSLNCVQAALIYDREAKTCRAEGDLKATIAITLGAYYELSDRHSRLLYGDKQVDAWRREAQGSEQWRIK